MVHEVMAAISTSPFLSSMPSKVLYVLRRSSGFLPNPFSFTGAEKSVVKLLFTLSRSMRSWGRFGPASDG